MCSCIWHRNTMGNMYRVHARGRRINVTWCRVKNDLISHKLYLRLSSCLWMRGKFLMDKQFWNSQFPWIVPWPNKSQLKLVRKVKKFVGKYGSGNMRTPNTHLLFVVWTKWHTKVTSEIYQIATLPFSRHVFLWRPTVFHPSLNEYVWERDVDCAQCCNCSFRRVHIMCKVFHRELAQYKSSAAIMIQRVWFKALIIDLPES